MGRTSYNMNVIHTKRSTYGSGEYMMEECYTTLKLGSIAKLHDTS